MAEKVQLKISELLQDLQNGLTRDEIGVKYGLNKAQVKVVFRNPKLKFKKTIKTKDAAFELVDDVEEIPSNQLSMELGSTEGTVEQVEVSETTTEAAQVVEEVDAYTQQGVELTDDTVAEAVEAETTTPTPVPAAQTAQGVW